MNLSAQQFITDMQGNKISVVLSIETYQQLLDVLEEYEAIQSYDLAKSQPDEIISFSQAIQEIETQRYVL